MKKNLDLHAAAEDGSSGAEARKRGRPRSARADRAILDVAIRLLTEEGYSQMSIERVAAEAGVGKATIYRRFRGRQDLAAAAVAHVLEHDAFQAPDTGDSRTDLLRSLERITKAAGSDAMLSILGTVMAEQHRDPELLRRFWERVIVPHRATIVSILERGRERGEVRETVPPEVVGEALVGAFLAHRLSGFQVTPDWIESVLVALWEGIGTSPSRR